MTALYFAFSNSDPVNRDTFGRWDWHALPLNILIAFEPRAGFMSWKNRSYPTYGRTMLDSGAFSAWQSGSTIALEDLIKEAKTDNYDEAVALDVIGDPIASLNNALEMRACLPRVIPVFHYGEPWELLVEYKNQFDGRVGLGGIATGISVPKKIRWLEQAFARAYPARFHGFGVAQKDILMNFPFASADTASWHTGTRFGHSAAYPDIKLPRKSLLDNTAFDGTGYDLRSELFYYLQLQAEVQDRWANELLWAN
jgi:hypothetical protein